MVMWTKFGKTIDIKQIIAFFQTILYSPKVEKKASLTFTFYYHEFPTLFISQKET